jgi:hypothetical protein
MVPHGAPEAVGKVKDAPFFLRVTPAVVVAAGKFVVLLVMVTRA